MHTLVHHNETFVMNNITKTIVSVVISATIPFFTACTVSSHEEVASEQLEFEDSSVDGDIFPASPETAARLGLTEWRISVEFGAVMVRGYDDAEQEIGWVKIGDWSQADVSGKEITSSNGGLIRFDSSGGIDALTYDDYLFPAFASDVESFAVASDAESFRSCGPLAAAFCAASIAAAIITCGPAGPKCVVGVLKAAKCVRCFLGGGGGSGGGTSTTGPGTCIPAEPGPGPELIDQIVCEGS